MKPAYDPATGKNTIDMRRFLHGGEPRLTPAMATEASRRNEITSREFLRNVRTVMDTYLGKGWLLGTGGFLSNGTCFPSHAPARSQWLMVTPRDQLVLVHINETVHNSGEVTTWTEPIGDPA